MKARYLLVATVFILVAAPACAQQVADPDPERFLGEIEAFEAWDAKNTPVPDPVLFVGSSSIRMWPSAHAFEDRAVVNRGFGGSQTSDVLHFFDRIVAPYDPEAIVFYCGDNDVADGKPARQVVADIDRFVERVRERFGPIPIVFVAVKPSILRWEMRRPMNAVNQAIAERAERDPALLFADIWTPMIETGSPPDASLFLDDGLHLSARGYAVWNRVVREALESAVR